MSEQDRAALMTERAESDIAMAVEVNAEFVRQLQAAAEQFPGETSRVQRVATLINWATKTDLDFGKITVMWAVALESQT